jgi:hypothetical protein
MSKVGTVEARLEFCGRLISASFQDFVRRRAARLALKLDEGEGSTLRFACRVSGPIALIDAFEMACSLGPLDCLVLDVRRDDRT